MCGGFVWFLFLNTIFKHLRFGSFRMVHVFHLHRSRTEIAWSTLLLNNNLTRLPLRSTGLSIMYVLWFGGLWSCSGNSDWTGGVNNPTTSSQRAFQIYRESSHGSGAEDKITGRQTRAPDCSKHCDKSLSNPYCKSFLVTFFLFTSTEFSVHNFSLRQSWTCVVESKMFVDQACWLYQEKGIFPPTVFSSCLNI